MKNMILKYKKYLLIAGIFITLIILFFLIINIISSFKMTTEEKNITLYIKEVNKKIKSKKNYSPYICEIQDNGDINCVLNFDNNDYDIIGIYMKDDKPTGGTIIFDKGKIVRIDNLEINGKKYNYEKNRSRRLIEIPEIAGLYDENYNLLLTWDELVNNYGLNLGVLHYGQNHKPEGSIQQILDNENFKEGKILKLPDNITTLVSYAFANCINLTNIIIPESVTNIGGYAFSGCINLTSITIPNSVNTIEQGTFQGCSKLSNIIIPNSVKTIGPSAFSGCTKFNKATFVNQKGWYIVDLPYEIKGTSVDVTNARKNATNLKDIYSSKYWKRS